MSKPTKDSVIDRINRGQTFLDTAHKLIFATWHNAYVTDQRAAAKKGTKRASLTVKTFTLTDLETSLEIVMNLYRQQEDIKAAAKIDYSTMSFGDRARARAKIIREAAAKCRDQAIATGKTVKFQMPKISF